MRISSRVGVAAGIVLLLAGAAPAGDAGEVGLLDLIQRLGAGNEPTGAGVVVAQTEAPSGTNDYKPDAENPEFAGKSFFPLSGAGGISGHATTVGRNYYGIATSIAPGVSTIYLYTVGGMVQGNLLRTFASGQQPFTPPGGIRIINDSWIGSFGNIAWDNDCIRRADFVTRRDNVLFVNGLNNGGANAPLMMNMYNGLAVGRADGGHTSGVVGASYDGAGRTVPQIVAPGSATSWATPVISAGAALMIETAVNDLGPTNPNADRTEVLKAVLLAGTTHRAGWSNDPATSGPLRGITDTPLDPVFGTDLLNVNRSHLILTGGEHEGATEPPPTANAPAVGWDLAISLAANTSRYYRFNVTETADEVSIVATWNRIVFSSFSGWFEPDVDLVLWRVDDSGELESLAGDPGLDDFADGNIISQSLVENIEHLYITGLEPGAYTLEARRVDVLTTVFDVAVAWLLPEGTCPCDLDGDGEVGVDDLLIVLGAWGTGPGGDCTGDGATNVNDLLALLAAWGPC